MNRENFEIGKNRKWNRLFEGFGEWVIVGTIGAAALPPLIGMVAIVVLLTVVAKKSGEIRPVFFAEYDVLRKKEKENTLTRGESKQLEEYKWAQGQAEKERRAKLWDFSCLSIAVCFCYLVVKALYIFQSAHGITWRLAPLFF